MNGQPINPATQDRQLPALASFHDSRTDREYLDRFVADRDQSAFASLVDRHGPMVLSVCRRILHDVHEAEDAYQTTFLVLARKAGSLRRPDLLANWLYGVACRSARKTQRQTTRYRAQAMKCATMQATDDATADVMWQDLRPVLDEELNRLPGKYRLAVVLCYLQGLTVEQASRQLGCPRGTILSRLARARERLRSRLTRRGLALSAGLLALLLLRSSTAGTLLPTTFVQSTVRAAISFVTCPAPAGLARVRSAVVAQAVMRSMFLGRLTSAAICLAVVGLIVTGVAVSVRWARPTNQTTPVGAQSGETIPNQDPAANVAPAPKDDKELLEGTWRGITIALPGQQPQLAEQLTFKFTREELKVDCQLFGQPWNPSFGYQLDSKAQPKRITMTTNGREELIGIYELNGDSLKICTVMPGANWPSNFTSQGAQTLWVFKRESKK
jgi:RNA polymerase sigma factor (sigma-70 family)